MAWLMMSPVSVPGSAPWSSSKRPTAGAPRELEGPDGRFGQGVAEGGAHLALETVGLRGGGGSQHPAILSWPGPEPVLGNFPHSGRGIVAGRTRERAPMMGAVTSAKSDPDP